MVHRNFSAQQINYNHNIGIEIRDIKEKFIITTETIYDDSIFVSFSNKIFVVSDYTRFTLFKFYIQLNYWYEIL